MKETMKRYFVINILAVTAIVWGVYLSCSKKADTPRVLIYDSRNLMESKERLQAGDRQFKTALDSLKQRADLALQQGPWSVMDKPFMPPSGDKHDYMSVGPYWWPNPDTEDGLPYIRKDGLVNPERYEYDSLPMKKMRNSVRTLSLAYYFTGHEPYAAHAAKLLRVWFLDEETHMNPNLNYGQAIAGRTKGRGIGIIDTHGYVFICESIELLQRSKHWTDKDHAAMKQWFDQYLQWLLNSEHGKYEASKENNHGTFYDLLSSRLAFFVDRVELAEEILSQVPEKRIALQIEPDGRQPHELSRTRSFAYSSWNLLGFFRLALLAEHAGLDLWHFSTKDGRSIRGALEFLLPYALQEKEWPYQMIQGWEDNLNRLYVMLQMAAQKYDNPEYEKMIKKLPIDHSEMCDLVLLYPGNKIK
jgi:hypothetical protein